MTKLAVFFPYFGAKFMRAPKYPEPLHDTIVEPFAGAAGYSVRHFARRVLLIDASEKICGIWRYLIAAKSSEIAALPLLAPGEDVQTLRVPQEAQWLIGFWCNAGSAAPARRLGRASNRRSGAWGEYVRARLAGQVDHIRHWRVMHGDYSQAPDIEATWFIDPPYEKHGRYYPHRISDFAKLAAWCRLRRGQTMVCESAGATWLPFEPITTVVGASHNRSTEVLWCSS